MYQLRRLGFSGAGVCCANIDRVGTGSALTHRSWLGRLIWFGSGGAGEGVQVVAGVARVHEAAHGAVRELVRPARVVLCLHVAGGRLVLLRAGLLLDLRVARVPRQLGPKDGGQDRWEGITLKHHNN